MTREPDKNQAASVMPDLHVRNGGFSIAITALKFVAGAFGVWLLMARPDQFWVGLLLAVAGFAFAIFELAQFTNRKIMLTVSDGGVLDHRQTPEVLVPWSAIRRVEQGGVGESVAPFLQLRRAHSRRGGEEIDERYFRLDCEFLELSPRRIAEHMKRFSPGLEIDMGMLSTLRGDRQDRSAS